MDNPFFKKQIITYMGNKRKLIPQINDILDMVKDDLKKELVTVDVFSGSGIVSRLLKTKSKKLFTNDLAGYAVTLNSCFLSTPSEEKKKKIKEYIDKANIFAHRKDNLDITKFVQIHWAAPQGEISKKHRVFFTQENGVLIDRYRHFINSLPEEYKSYLLAILLVKCSIHNNTNGQFSAFYKDENGFGKFGGKKEIDIKRITSLIKLEIPNFSSHPCEVVVSQKDANQFVKSTPEVDLVYLDPPYNKHPYSIYYFMLDIINNWKTDEQIPDTNRGQPKTWKKSDYNSFNKAEDSFKDLIVNIKSKFILLSYNNKGIIPIKNIETILKEKGKLYTFPLTHKTYNKLKGIAAYKRKKEWSEVKEFMWLVDTRKN
jgi:adenine-specific DNA-methyltransferase